MEVLYDDSEYFTNDSEGAYVVTGKTTHDVEVYVGLMFDKSTRDFVYTWYNFVIDPTEDSTCFLRDYDSARRFVAEAISNKNILVYPEYIAYNSPLYDLAREFDIERTYIMIVPETIKIIKYSEYKKLASFIKEYK